MVEDLIMANISEGAVADACTCGMTESHVEQWLDIDVCGLHESRTDKSSAMRQMRTTNPNMLVSTPSRPSILGS